MIVGRAKELLHNSISKKARDHLWNVSAMDEKVFPYKEFYILPDFVEYHERHNALVFNTIEKYIMADPTASFYYHFEVLPHSQWWQYDDPYDYIRLYFWKDAPAA